MRSAGNFHPEWGYLAPAPSFMRTARIVLVATAIGATAGAAVMISLVQHPATDAANGPIAAHALVTSVPVVAEAPLPAEPVDEPLVTQTPTPATTQSVVAVTAPPAEAAPSLASNPVSASKPKAIVPPAQASGSVAELAGPASPVSAALAEAEASPAAAPDKTVTEPQAPSKQTKKHRTAAYDPIHRTQPPGRKGQNKRPFNPLFRLFSSSGGPRDSF